MTEVVVVGSSNTDMVVRARHLPRPGETVLGGAFARTAGGKGANQAVAAARLGADVTFVARVGTDTFGDAALAGFRAEGIECRFVTQDADAPSGVTLIGVDDNTGENLILVASGANAKLSADDMERARPAIEGAAVLLCQLESPLETVTAAFTVARAAGVVTILNPAPAQVLSNDLLTLVDVLTPNETEAALLTGAATPTDAARHLRAQGVLNVIVTLGADGVLLVTAQSEEHLPGLRVPCVADTTAAGDCFNGALAVALGEGRTMRDAVQFAQHAAALSVTKAGAQPSLPTRAEVEEFRWKGIQTP